MFLLLRCVFLFGLVELGVLSLHLVLDEALVANLDVVVQTPGDLLAQVLQALGRGTQLTHLLNLKTFSLFLHVLKENAKVGRDAIRSLQVLDVVALIELLAQILAHGLNVDDGLWESDIRLTSVFEANWTQDLKFLVLLFQVKLLIFLSNLNALLGLAVADTFELLELLFETTAVQGVMPDRADGLHKGHSHPNADGLLIFGDLIFRRGFVVRQVVINGFFTKILKLVDKLVHTLLCLLTLGHLGTHALLSQTTWLSIGLSETFLG